MPRRRAHAPLKVLINNRLCGRLEKQANGAISFQYDPGWLAWAPAFPVSLSLPLQNAPWRGEAVVAVFDNLLPDNPYVRRQVAERTGAGGADAYSLLAQIGRDCVGAMQFIPDGDGADALQPVEGAPISDEEIEALLANLARAPLGIDADHAYSQASARRDSDLVRGDRSQRQRRERALLPDPAGEFRSARRTDRDRHLWRAQCAGGGTL